MSAAKRKNNLETLFETIKELNTVDLNIENVNSFLSIPDMNIETAIKIFSGINKDTSFSKKNVSIVEIKDKINNFVETFKDCGLTHKAFTKSLHKKPSVLNKPAEETKNNVNKIVKKFNDVKLTTKEYVSAAAKQPQLFYIQPDAIHNSVQGVCDEFKKDELPKRKYLDMALTAPTLFAYNPQTTAKHIREIRKMYDEKLFADEGSFFDVLGQRPIALSFGDDNLAERKKCARLIKFDEEKPVRFTTLFRYTKTELQQKISSITAKSKQPSVLAKKKAGFSK